eukprot:TRINITY_DN184_c0_g1_i1.p1 TRINITY_DN184_c0_g1~~TRINITY_DN184_c0_g1_i1.p1  ORF type:complete len:336 (-),score=163.31 TRINITY_DN184_c0_g1_i1:259-1266(-)
MGRKAPAAAAPEAEKPAEEVEDTPLVKELKGYDDEYLKLEREYDAEVRKLREKYNKLYQPILEERTKLLVAKPKDKDASAKPSATPALPGFWLQALQNHPAMEGEIHDYDEDVLMYLRDVTAEELSYEKEIGFKLSFHFDKNPYFEHAVLTKTYHTEEKSPYTGEQVCKKVECTEIEWNSGKNITVETVVKKVKGGGKKKAKQKGKESEQPRPSFFRDFFRSLKEGDDLPEDMKQMMLGDESMSEDDMDEGIIDEILEEQMDMGSALRDEVVTFAVRWFTGEAVPEGAGGDDEDEESEEDDDDDDDDDDEDESPKKRGGKKGGAGGGKKEECKQQ